MTWVLRHFLKIQWASVVGDNHRICLADGLLPLILVACGNAVAGKRSADGSIVLPILVEAMAALSRLSLFSEP